MTIHLSKDLERFVHDAVRAGLYSSEDAVIRDLRFQRLGQALRQRGRNGLGAPNDATQPIHRDLYHPHHRRRGHLCRRPPAQRPRTHFRQGIVNLTACPEIGVA